MSNVITPISDLSLLPLVDQFALSVDDDEHLYVVEKVLDILIQSGKLPPDFKETILEESRIYEKELIEDFFK